MNGSMNSHASSTAPPLAILVVDDEPPARRRLIRLLASHENTNVVAEAASVAEARARLAQFKPDLAFIDIQLRGEDAFTLLASADVSAAVVFVTAHAEHAVRAFECDVVDYLLKPVRPERLAEALARAERWRAAHEGRAVLAPASAISLVLGHRGGLRRICFEDIVHIVARDDHTELYLRDGTSHLHSTRMDGWERRLPPSFLRTHRSHIVNLQGASSVFRRTNGWVLELEGELIPISRSRLDGVRAALSAASGPPIRPPG
jgi:DNA-binding LytR/AlgR family response regulator